MPALALASPVAGHAPATRDARCTTCLGRWRSICAVLPAEAIDDMARIGRLRRLRRGEVLSWEDDEAYEVGSVRDGALKLTASLRDGREQIVGVAWPGAFVGELVADRSFHRLTALTATTICLFRRSDLDMLIARHPALARALLQSLSRDLDGARRSILSLGRKTATERVASLLIDMRRTAVPDQTGIVQMSLNRQQMADLLGLTIETVSRKIRRFERNGVIELIGTRLFRVLDDIGLARLAG
jgi:CRP/FNR family transcriptional regulator